MTKEEYFNQLNNIGHDEKDDVEDCINNQNDGKYAQMTMDEFINELNKDAYDEKETDTKCKAVVFDETALFYHQPTNHYDADIPLPRSKNLGKDENDTYCGGLDRKQSMIKHLLKLVTNNIKIAILARKSEYLTHKLLSDTGLKKFVDNIYHFKDPKLQEKICERYNVTSSYHLFYVHSDSGIVWLLKRGRHLNVDDPEDEDEEDIYLNGATKRDMQLIETKVLTRNADINYNIDLIKIQNSYDDDDEGTPAVVLKIFDLLLNEWTNCHMKWDVYNPQEIERISRMYVDDYFRLDNSEELQRQETQQYILQFVDDLLDLVIKEYNHNHQPWTYLQILFPFKKKYKVHNTNFQIKIGKYLGHLKHRLEPEEIFEEVLRQDPKHQHALIEDGFYQLTNAHNPDKALDRFIDYSYYWKHDSSITYWKSCLFGLARGWQCKGDDWLASYYYQKRINLGAIKPNIQFYIDKLKEEPLK